MRWYDNPGKSRIHALWYRIWFVSWNRNADLYPTRWWNWIGRKLLFNTHGRTHYRDLFKVLGLCALLFTVILLWRILELWWLEMELFQP